mmetsp:Transcript_11126/g.26406  ORF Transcript_11126/g.26406 Transcript_11126/m.26406 type:complete len:259 (+) Transcript_11126:383-1159(+)
MASICFLTASQTSGLPLGDGAASPPPLGVASSHSRTDPMQQLDSSCCSEGLLSRALLGPNPGGLDANHPDGARVDGLELMWASYRGGAGDPQTRAANRSTEALPSAASPHCSPRGALPPCAPTGARVHGEAAAPCHASTGARVHERPPRPVGANAVLGPDPINDASTAVRLSSECWSLPILTKLAGLQSRWCLCKEAEALEHVLRLIASSSSILLTATSRRWRISNSSCFWSIAHSNRSKEQLGVFSALGDTPQKAET